MLFSTVTKGITWSVEGDMFVGLYSLIKELFFNFNVNNFFKGIKMMRTAVNTPQNFHLEILMRAKRDANDSVKIIYHKMKMR